MLAEKIKNISAIGAGAMGAHTALCFAMGGLHIFESIFKTLGAHLYSTRATTRRVFIDTQNRGLLEFSSFTPTKPALLQPAAAGPKPPMVA